MRTFAVPLMFLIVAEQILASMQWVGSGVAMHAYAIANQMNSAVTSITTAGAIGWFGMWMGLRSRKQHMAVIKTFVFVFILPAVAIGIVQMILMITVSFAGFGGTGGQVLGPAITCVLWVMKDAAFILWARRNLYWHFREGVAGINSPRPVFKPLETIRSGFGRADSNLKHDRHPFVENQQMLVDAVAMRDFLEPARRFIEVFERKFERAVVHGDEPLCADVAKHFDGVVGSHVDMAK